MNGAFRVYQENDNPRDIHFELRPEWTGEIPTSQLQLRDQCHAALTVIGIICPDDRKFNEYFQPLLSLAQAGLVGETANPDLAQRALDGLKQEITAREAGRIKNTYMKKLGYWALLAIGVFCTVLLALRLFHAGSWPKNLAVFEIGTMIGVWLSFGTRKPVLKFEELHILEEDQLEPVVRLIFAALLAGTLALVLYLHVVNVTLGALNTDRIAADAWAALLFGVLSGVGEKALSTNVSHQAAALFKT